MASVATLPFKIELPQCGEQLLEVWVPGIPQQRGSKRSYAFKRKNGTLGVGVADDNEKSKDWMASVALAAQGAMGVMPIVDSPVAVQFAFEMPRPKSHFGTGRNAGTLKASSPVHHAQSPDLAKLIRATEDALTGIVWKDDRQVCRYVHGTGKFWTAGKPGAWIRVYRT